MQIMNLDFSKMNLDSKKFFLDFILLKSSFIFLKLYLVRKQANSLFKKSGFKFSLLGLGFLGF
jgi:hypothetical protein